MPGASRGKNPEQRVLVSALYGEIAGISSLADQLEPEIAGEGIQALWEDLLKIINEFGGTVPNQLEESFLVIWGIPESLEDDAERSVSAALALQEGLRKYQEASKFPAAKALKLRIGIHSGLALVGPVGPAGEFSALGDTITITRYLGESAELNSIVISEATYQSIRGAFQVKRLTPVQLDGTQRLLSIFQILEELPQPTKLRYRGRGGLETILVGRKDEMAQLESLYQQTKESGTPHLALVTGDVGVGKSRLLFEFAGLLETENPLLTVMSSRALEQTSQIPYYLWKELWSNRFELNEDDPTEIAQKKTISGVLTLWGQTLGEITAVEAAHFLGGLIGINWEKSPYLEPFIDNPKGRFERAYALQSELFFRASQHGPIVLILDDLQWADTGSLALIQHLWKSSGHKMPILILACARTEFLTKEIPFQEANLISLSPLPISSQVVREAYPVLKEAPEDLVLSLAEQAEGNPYFMEELVKNVLAVGMDDSQILSFPQSLEELLQSRLDRLSLEARATALFAAVVGRVFWKGAVMAIFRGSPGITDALSVTSHNLVGKVQKALDELMEQEMAFLRVGSAFGGDREYIFKHSLLQEVAYQRIPEDQRQACHLAAADWLAERASPERSINVAQHYEKAGVYDQAQNFYTQAAEQARSIGHDEEADELQYHARTLPENNSAVREE
jgi:class 3 adenylate cyclase